MPLKKIALLTSGGDAPGMNPCIRAVTRRALQAKLEVWGSRRGYTGLVENDFVPLERASVSNTICAGGSLLVTSRCQPFFEAAGRRRAFENCQKNGIEAIVVIGGNGSMQGAHLLTQETKLPVIGLPGTIDNDIYGSELSIGFDTAVNTALEAIDRIRDTASAMERIFFIEVMGRHCGNIALHAGVAGGADWVCLPEVPTHLDRLCIFLKQGFAIGKRSNIVVVAEGDDLGNAETISQLVEKETGLKSWVSKLGYIQRGGRPTARDRFFATECGIAAVDDLLAGQSGHLIGLSCSQIGRTPLHEAATKKKEFDWRLYELLKLQE